MTVQEFPEKAKLKCCREENCGMDECVTPCETAEWELAKLKFNQKCKTLNYPGQERFGKSNKLFIHLGERRMNRQEHECVHEWTREKLEGFKYPTTYCKKCGIAK